MDNYSKTARPGAVAVSPERWRAIILGVGFWSGLFGAEMSIAPPWGMQGRPVGQTPAKQASAHVVGAARVPIKGLPTLTHK